MKTTSKFLAMLLVVVMCMSFFGGLTAFADYTVTATVTQTTTPAQDSDDPANFVIGCDENVSVSAVVFDGWDASGYFSQSGSNLTVTGVHWDFEPANVEISFVDGDTASFAWGGSGTAAVTIKEAPEPPVVPFNVWQKDAPSSTAYSFDSSKDLGASFRYGFTGELGSVSVDGNDITALCSVTLGSGIVSIPANAVIAYGSTSEATHYVTFTSADGASSFDFTIVDTKKYTSDDPTNNGKQQTPTIEYLIGSGTTVCFDTTADPNDVQVYDRTEHYYAPGVSYSYGSTIYGTGITFDNSFLDSLKAGRTYEIWCVYGAGKGQGVLVGYLRVGNKASSAGYETSLVYTNGNVSDTETKWVSGSIKPEMYSPLFLVDGAYLQVSSNGGASWSNVGINDYMIKLDNGKRTAYAYFGDSYLNKLAADSIYYYRVYVPAGKIDTSEVHSNAIMVVTGPTLTYIDTDKHVINSTKNLRFKSSSPVSKVFVGNIELTDPNYFSVSNDKKTITLSPEFLNSRTAGQTYTLSVITADGEKLSTTFQILTTGQASSSPRTGDESQIGLWAAFLVVSGAAAVAVLPRLRKNED